jgi:hypothetical protein
MRDSHESRHDLGIGAALELDAAARDRELQTEVIDIDTAVASTGHEQDAEDESLHYTPAPIVKR